MRIDYMQYDKHGRPIGIPGHLMCDHGAIRDECEICRRDVLIAELRERLEKAEQERDEALEKAEEAGARKMWEKMSEWCDKCDCPNKLSDDERDRLISDSRCTFETCPLRQDADKQECLTPPGAVV